MSIYVVINTYNTWTTLIQKLLCIEWVGTYSEKYFALQQRIENGCCLGTK